MITDRTDDRRAAFGHVLRAVVPCLAALTCLMITGGCSMQTDASVNHTDAPPDFALNVLVVGPPDEANPLRKTSRYLLESNRTLRAIRGSRATNLTFPPIARRLGRSDVNSLARLVARHHLMAEPTSPLAEVADDGNGKRAVLYELEITAHGRVHRYRTTPPESPPTIRLVAELARLADR